MPFLTETDASYLREKFAEILTQPVELRLFTEPDNGLYVPGRPQCETCADTEALLTEVAELADSIHLEIVNVAAEPEVARLWGVTRVPTIAVGPLGSDAGVRFQGLPDGYEFTSFVETIATAGSANGHGLQPETLEALAALPADVEIKTFVTPT
jgi:alkyl hydroperoxide reductase subunit AhpF